MRYLLIAAPMLSACHQSIQVDPDALAFLQVETIQSSVGTKDAPSPFSTEPVTVRLKVTALNRDADPYPVDAPLNLRSRPGNVVSPPSVSLSGGTWEGDVTFQYGFGPTRIWFVDDVEGDDWSPTYVTGVSDAGWFRFPTLAEMQATEDHTTNPLEGEFAEIRTDDRTVVVTAVGANGMWVTDLDDPPGGYNALFVYTFNRPRFSVSEEGEYGEVATDDGDVEVGARLAVLSGGSQEYLASTQLSFPQYEFVAGESHTPPEPIVLEETVACDDDAMEMLESSLVRAEDVEIPSSFTGTDQDYQSYGQWPLRVGSCTVYADSQTTIPDFHPTEYSGERLEYVQGMLTEVWGKWIILPRDPQDISVATRRPTASTSTSALPRRPRPVPAPSTHQPTRTP